MTRDFNKQKRLSYQRQPLCFVVLCRKSILNKIKSFQLNKPKPHPEGLIFAEVFL
jgi:hypothetical protein